MTGLRLSVGISMVLLVGGVCAESRDVNLVQETEQFDKGNKVAIVVGVENYDQRLTGFRQLDYAEDDARQVAEVLQGLGYKTELLVNNQAGRDIVLSRIREVGKTLQNGEGTLVFYFSGHGFAAEQDNYLATYGSVAHLLQDSGLGVSSVVKAIRNTGVRRAVLLVDACRNDPRPGIRSGGTSFEDVDSGEGVQVFYSTRFGDVSWEHDAFKHGVFSHFLVQGLSGQGVQNGLVTFNSLANYVEQQVANWTSSNMSQTQQPFRRSDGDFFGDFVLARLGNNTVSPVGEQNVENQNAYYDYSGGASEVVYGYESVPAASTTYYDYAPSSTVLNQQDKYLVQPRDTIFQVMRNTGVYWKDIVKLNNLDAPDYVLTPGQVIRLR